MPVEGFGKDTGEVSEHCDPKPSTGILHSAGPLFQLEQSMRSEVSAISPFVDKLMVFIRKCQCVPGNEFDVEISCEKLWQMASFTAIMKILASVFTSTAAACPMRKFPLWSGTKDWDLAAPSSLTRPPPRNSSRCMVAAST